MIKRNKSIIVIISLSLFLFIAYNVITVQAAEKDDNDKRCQALSEPDDDFYCDDFDWSASTFDNMKAVDELCDASEDYAKNPKNCDKAYDLVEKNCAKTGGKILDGECTYEDVPQEEESDNGDNGEEESFEE